MNTFNSDELFGAFLIFVAIFLIIVFLDFFYHFCTAHKLPAQHMYSRRTTIQFHTKKILARLLLKLGKRKAISIDEVDRMQKFSESDEMPVDAVYFNTCSDDKQILVFGTARRKNGLVNAMGFIKVPEFSDKLMVIPVFPDSTLYQNDVEQKCMDAYSVAGIKITSVTPMKEYRIQYYGKMRFDCTLGKAVDVELNALWRTNLSAFNFSTEISKFAMSEAMAFEPWSRSYFNILKSHHQTHYEQYGNVEGTIKIDQTEYKIKTSGVRDRTIGARRNWSDFRRYVLHYIRLENGNAVTIGVISMPVMFTRLVIGFVSNAKDNVNIPIDNCSIDLDEFGTQPPEHYQFDFNTYNDSFRVHVDRHTKTEISMGAKSEVRLVETWCDFKINGVKGFGGVEWQYRNDK